MERVKQHGIRGAKVFSELAGAASWIVLVVGLLAIWGGARWYMGAGGAANTGHVVVESAQWDPGLAGASVRLPSSDVRGAPLPKTKHILLSFSCGECVKPGVLEAAVRFANLPVVLVTRGPLQQVHASLRDSSFPAWLVLDPDALHVPAAFLDKAPQLALVNNGKIIEVPGRDETAETFLRRVR